MLFFPYVFPQLAVSAKLLCLLMVICGAVPSMVRSVELYSSNSGRFVLINDRGRVSAEEKKTYEEKYFNLTIKTIDFCKLSIYSEQTRRYLCFSKDWRLKGVKVLSPRNKRLCQFSEEINTRGFTTFQSVANDTLYIAFNKQGKALKKPSHRLESRDFLKLGTSFNIAEHNAVVSGVKEGGRVPNKTRHKHSRKRGHY